MDSWLKDIVHTKAVDDPKARLGDPAAFDSLTDEQRDAVNEWYWNNYEEDESRHKNDIKMEQDAVCFAMVPFAAEYAYSWDSTFGWTFWYSGIAAYLFFIVIVYVFTYTYKYVLAGRTEPKTKADKVKRFFLVSFMYAVAAIVSVVVVMIARQ